MGFQGGGIVGARKAVIACVGFVFLAGAFPAQAQVVSTPLSSPTPAANTPTGTQGKAPWMDSWVGADFSNSYYGGYFGGVWALNDTRSLWVDGFVFRIDGGAGHYGYRTFAIPYVSVFTYAADIMAGYRTKVGEGLLTGYVGLIDVAHENPDPTAKIRGNHVGVRLLADYSVTFNDRVELYGQASYQSPFNSYFALARVGVHPFANLWIGPEAQIFGIDAPYQDARFGGYVKFDLGFGEVSANGGLVEPLTGGPAGFYAGLFLGYSFR
jgi:hypothetical protein